MPAMQAVQQVSDIEPFICKTNLNEFGSEPKAHGSRIRCSFFWKIEEKK